MVFRYDGNSHKAGIYKILNLINGRFYIGSCARFKERWREHELQLLRGKHSNAFLQNDFNKSGSNAYELIILELVEGTREARLASEQRYLDTYYDHQKTCYNIAQNALSREGSKSRNPESTKAKMSQSRLGRKRGPLSEETKKKIALAKFGKKHSEETKAKMALAKLGKKRPDTTKRLLENNPMKNGHTMETRQKIAESHKKRLFTIK